MIPFVRGTVVQAHADQLVVDLGSVGLTVLCTPGTALSVRHGEHIELMTTMVVREDGWTLYGFVDPDERTVFERVQTVSGIGPRIALALLASLSPDELRGAVVNGDEAALTLRQLCSMHPPTRCDEAREAWRAAQVRWPSLALILAP